MSANVAMTMKKDTKKAFLRLFSMLINVTLSFFFLFFEVFFINKDGSFRKDNANAKFIYSEGVVKPFLRISYINDKCNYNFIRFKLIWFFSQIFFRLTALIAKSIIKTNIIDPEHYYGRQKHDR